MNGSTLEYLDYKFRSDEEFMFDAIKAYGYSLQYASEDLKYNKNFLKKCIKISPTCYEYIPDEYKENEKFAMEAYEIHCQVFLVMIPKHQSIINRALDDHPKYLKHLNRDELMLKSVLNLIIKYEIFWYFTEEIVMRLSRDDLKMMVRKCGKIYELLPRYLKNEKDIIISIVCGGKL